MILDSSCTAITRRTGARRSSVELERARRASIDDGKAEGLIPANDDRPDADGEDIPDANDCAPSKPNPEGKVITRTTTIYD